MSTQALPDLKLHDRIASRTITLNDRDGLLVHVLEALPAIRSSPAPLPLILLLHGFPELAYSWRKVLAPLADARGGYHVVAPDLRGFGRTREHSVESYQYDDPLAPFNILNIVEDVCALVRALGYTSVALLVGHDFGSPVAGHCVIAHPDLFKSVVFMSAPFTGIEKPVSADVNTGGSGASDGTDRSTASLTHADAVQVALAALSPPRKHYTAYFSTPNANKEMLGEGPEALYHILGAYFHMKSGAWEGNNARPLQSASMSPPTIQALAADLATLPEYYVMPLHENMRQVIFRHTAGFGPGRTWPRGEEDAGAVYAAEFGRTGFQGALNYYRSALSPPPLERTAQLIALAERRADVPAAFISGMRDWGVYQTPRAEAKMKQFFGMGSEDFVLIEGAGHWIQQEAPQRVVEELVSFLDRVDRNARGTIS
ncbi:Alpha/Beta hydrolase protein [Phlebopus sp. FC_14]|nr:Alpha/Beta hydrolase protein [Phlebopus sp. FC_14]